MRAGSVLEIDAEGERLVDLVAGGKTIGKGELVLVEGKLGVRIVKYF
jgi:flagellar motor switch/type III secretory pathway protein FliN